MTADDLSFERDGAVRLPRAFDASGLADELWAGLASRHRVLRDDRSTWPEGWFGKLTKFGKSGRFAAVGSDVVRAAVTEVLGSGWGEQTPWGQPLVTFPMPGEWNVPHSWHIDFPAASPLPALRMFAYLTRVEAGGGGTLIVAGSHRLAEQRLGMRSADLRKELARQAEWFRVLGRRSDDPGRTKVLLDGDAVESVHVRVVELTGEPGDVILWHPSLLHAVAPNCRDVPRFMLTHTALPGQR